MRLEKLNEYYNSPEYINRLKKRIEVLQECEEDPLLIQKLTIESWSVNPIDFIEQFGWIINPKYNNEIKPFFLFPYQKRVIQHIWECEIDGKEHEILIDKPREMGLTWVLVWYQIWRWLFTQNWSGFDLSRTETEVDDGTTDPSSSLFGKYRWSIAMLPQWITPDQYVPKGKKGNPTDMLLRLTNPNKSSSLIGSTSNENAGRSRRYSFTFVDECFFIERFQTVRRSLSSVSNVRVYVSTAKVGKVYKDFVDWCEQNGDYISLTWRDNPFKDDEWYKRKLLEAEIDPEAMKEVEVGYAVSSAFQYYPEIAQAKVVEGMQYDRSRPLYISLDYGRQDHTVLIWWQFDGQNFNILECVAKNKVDFEWFTPFMNPEITYNEEKYIGYYKNLLAKIRTWKKPAAYFGEPAHLQVHYPSNTSIQKELAKFGIRLMVNNYAIKHEVRRKATSMLLPKCVFNQNSDGVMELYDSIINSRYAGSAKGTSKEAQMKPAHDDETGDYRSAFENGCCNMPRILRLQRADLGDDMKPKTPGGNMINSLIKYLRV